MRSILVLVVAAALLSAAPVAAAATDAQRFARAVTLEREGKLERAFTVLGRMEKPTKAQATHRTHVGDAIHAIAAADALAEVDDHAGARAALDAQRKQLDPVADRFVLAVLAKESTDAGEQAAAAAKAARADADAQAQASIDKAKALADDDEWEKAAGVYKAVATKPADSISAELRQTAVIGQINAEQEAAAAAPGALRRFFDSVWDVFRNVFKWLVIALPVAALFGVAALVRKTRRRRPTAGQTSISLSDLNGDAKERNRRDHALAREMYDAVQDVRHGTVLDDAAALDERRDLDGTAAPLIDVSRDASALDSVTAGENQIQVGPLKVSPIQLYYFVKAYVARPGEFELRGTLRADEHGAQFAVERISTSNPQTPPRRWSSVAKGEGARGSVIRDVAAKYAVECGISYISANWRSYQCYRAAIAALEALDEGSPDKREEAFDPARIWLVRALDHDGYNVIARLRLATVLRTMGRNGEAAAQYERLMKDVCVPARLPAVAKAYVERHPELYYVAAYNRAVALSKLASKRRYGASADLALLVARLGNRPPPVLDEEEQEKLTKAFEAKEWPPAPQDGDGRRYFVLTYSAWGASLLATADQPDAGSREDVARLQERRVAVLTRLEAIKKELAGGDQADSMGALRQADAVLDNAIARILYRERKYDAARDAAEQALVVTPDLGDAHITLASIAMATGSRDGEWVSETKRHLEQALAISPKDQRAIYQLGKLYVKIEEPAKAKEYFSQLPDDWKARDRLGEVYLRDGEYAEAVRHFSRSQALNESHDYRATRLVDTVLELAQVQGAFLTKRDADEANDAAERLAKVAKGEQRREADVRVGRLKEVTQRLVSSAPHVARYQPEAPPQTPPVTN